jgi:hypothetical protein
MKETMKEAGYRYHGKLDENRHILFNILTERYEVWFNNKNHASYGIRFKNTHLEFAREASYSEFPAQNPIRK